MSHKSMKTKKNWIPSGLPSLLLLILGVMAFRSSFAEHYYVSSGSMGNTLFSGDRVLVSKSAYGLRAPFTKIELLDGEAVARGDVVIFDSPRDGTRLIKRIVGVGGDRIDINAGLLWSAGNLRSMGLA